MGWLNRDRMFDPLRAEPRFVVLMKKLRFALSTTVLSAACAAKEDCV